MINLNPCISKCLFHSICITRKEHYLTFTFYMLFILTQSERKYRSICENISYVMLQEPATEFMTNDFLFFRSSSINRSYMEEYRPIMIPNTYCLRGMELPQRTTDASEFLRA